ncbi:MULTISPECIES: hypothetical protein [Nocardia]|uniref:hypothetical protein n=1 Tax=Nocardia TaxID=1817 RepID=UPI0018962096|nr:MULTISPECIES: hypothetical protein [Nocardia]MBF6350123.1 hypothetical protein [Nocardia flavorosea]
MSPVPQPPFPAELLADLHAGNIDPELEARLWPAVRQDPDARRYLESLDAVRRSLTGLAESDRVVRPMPADIAARLAGFAESLGSETAHQDGADSADTVEATVPLGDIPAPAFTVGPGAANARRSTPAAECDDEGPISLDAYRRRRRLAAALAAAAAVLICAGAALFIGIRPDGETMPTAAPTETTGTETGAALDMAAALRVLGRHDVPGRLADPAALTACVRAAGVDRPVLGSTEMRFRERDDAVLILVGGRNGAQVTALVVGPGCGPGNPELLAPITDIG